MQDYIKTLLEELPHAMGGIAKTAATNNLFNVNYKTKNLTEEMHSYSTMWWQNYYIYAEGQDRTYKQYILE